MDVALSLFLAVFAFVMALLGVRMTLYPPDTDAKKKCYERAFFVLGGLSVLLAFGQGVRNLNAQKVADKAQSDLATSLETIEEKTRELTLQGSRNEQLAKENLRLAAENQRLGALSVELAKRPTVLQRDLAPITFSVSEEPPNGDLRSCTVVVRTTISLVRPRLRFTFDRAPKNMFLEGVPGAQPWKKLDSSTLEYWYGGSGGRTVFSPDQPAAFHFSSPGPFRLKSVDHRE